MLLLQPQLLRAVTRYTTSTRIDKGSWRKLHIFIEWECSCYNSNGEREKILLLYIRSQNNLFSEDAMSARFCSVDKAHKVNETSFIRWNIIMNVNSRFIDCFNIAHLNPWPIFTNIWTPNETDNGDRERSIDGEKRVLDTLFFLLSFHVMEYLITIVI